MKFLVSFLFVNLIAGQDNVIRTCPDQCNVSTAASYLQAARQLFDAGVRHTNSGLANCHNKYSRFADLDSAFTFFEASKTDLVNSGSFLPKKSGGPKLQSALAEADLFDDCKTSIDFILAQMNSLLCGASEIIQRLECCQPLDLACCEVGLIEYAEIVTEYKTAVELLSRKFVQCQDCPKLVETCHQAPSNSWCSWFTYEPEPIIKDVECPAEDRIDGGRVYNQAAAEASAISRAAAFAALEVAKEPTCCSLVAARRSVMEQATELSAIFLGRIIPILKSNIKSDLSFDSFADFECQSQGHYVYVEYNCSPVDGCAQRLENIFETAETILASTGLILNDLSAATEKSQCEWDLEEIANSPEEMRNARTSATYALDSCIVCHI